MKVANLLPIFAFLSQVPLPERPNDFVEVCAGEGNLSSALRSSGFQGKEFDVIYSGNHNLMRTVGFLAIIAAVRNIRPGGLLVVAPPCNTWVVVSRSQTGRSWSNPGGNQRPCVQWANIFVLRLLYILLYAHQRGAGAADLFSLVALAPYAALFGFHKGSTCCISNGLLWECWSTLTAVSSLRRPLNIQQLRRLLDRKPLVKKTISKTGKPQVTGLPNQLKQSAAYPWAFGLAVGALLSPEGLPNPSAEMPTHGTERFCEDDQGALDDLIKYNGRAKAWWR
ncbi:unnamed protein product [Durusdinium trenchii]